MDKELFIHIGLGKAGSTSIQESLLLAQNREILNAEGFTYIPKSELHELNHWLAYSPFLELGQEDAEEKKSRIWESWRSRASRVSGYDPSAIRESFIRCVETREQNKIIISGEGLCGAAAGYPMAKRETNKLKYFLEPFSRITIILIVRNQASFLASAYQEAVVNEGESIDFPVFCRELLPYCNWLEHLEILREDFPGVDFKVTALELASPNGLLKSFCRLIGMRNVDGLLECRSNPGVNPVLLPVLKMWNRQLSLPNDINRLMRKYSFMEKKKPGFFPYDKTQLNTIKERVHDSNRKLFQRFSIAGEQEFLEWAKPYLEPPPGNVHNGENDLDSACETLGRSILHWLEKNKEETGKKNEDIRTASFLRGYIRCFIHTAYPRGQKVALYGAGSHTAIFLEELKGSGITPMPVVVAGDTGKLLFEGVEIFNPDAFDFDSIGKVIISSKTFEDEIFDELLEKGVPGNKIMRMYDNRG